MSGESCPPSAAAGAVPRCPARRSGRDAAWSPVRAWGRRGRRGMAWQDAALFCLLAGAGAWCVWRAGALPQYHWQWSVLGEFLVRRGADGTWEAGLLLRGLGVTVRIGFWSMLLALLTGALAGLPSAHARGLAALPSRVWVTIIRNTPPLVLLFFLYFFAGNLLPVAALEDAVRHLPEALRAGVALGFAPPGQMDRMLAAVMALGLYEGAYVAEIVRGSVESVPPGQWDAARALGFSRRQSLRLVILPQAARIAMPPLAGQTISAFKDSALASLISLPELTFQSLEVMAVSQMTFEIWISAGALYLLIGLACAALGRWLERRCARHERPSALRGVRV